MNGVLVGGVEGMLSSLGGWVCGCGWFVVNGGLVCVDGIVD